jgi:ribonuclease HI
VDAKTAESLAALEAVHFAREAEFLNAIFEGDAVHVIAEINSNPPYLSRSSHILESIHVERQSLHICSFNFVYREANCAAHCLAKEAVSTMNDLCLLENTPISISSIVVREAVCP